MQTVIIKGTQYTVHEETQLNGLGHMNRAIKVLILSKSKGHWQ